MRIISRFFHLVLSAFIGPGLLACTAPPDSVAPLIYVFPLADTTVEFHWHGPVHSGLMFLVIHDDENTSSIAGYEAMETFGASLLELKNDNKYVMTLIRDSVPFIFNPNRIFSLNGIESALLQFGPCSPEVVEDINLFAHQVAGAFFMMPEFIVALHNNQNRGFSIKSYQLDSSLIKVTDSLFINPAKDPDDFFYVNDPKHFTVIKEKGYNVILQRPNGIPDDGSLSVWCSRHGIPYINIEAEQGKLEEQLKMLFDVREMIFLQLSRGRPLPEMQLPD
jgi:hypothetical protein